MSTRCLRPCPVAAASARSLAELRAHLESGTTCADAWRALADLVSEPSHRLECLRRAVLSEPSDLDLAAEYLEYRVALQPDDPEAQGDLRALRAHRAISGYQPQVFRRMYQPPPLGTVLLSMGAITEGALEQALDEQKARRLSGRPILLGDLLVQRGLVEPALLARALIAQYVERSENGGAPQAIGEYLVASGQITPGQLEHALAEQSALRQRGRSETIGQILQRQGAVPAAALQRAFEEQQRDALSSFM